MSEDAEYAWHIIGAVLSTIAVGALVGGLVMLVVRVIQSRRVELQAVENGREVAAAMKEIERTLDQICERIAGSAITAKDYQTDIRDMIRSVTQLVLDVEKRLGGEIKENREWFDRVGKAAIHNYFTQHQGDGGQTNQGGQVSGEQR